MSTEVKTLTEDDDTILEERKVCPLCLKDGVKYTCPRCNTPYCSVNCYRSEKHKDCSEGFYKDCFMEGLKQYSADPADKQKMLDMLKRAEHDTDLNVLDEGEDDDLYERLSDLDLDKDTSKVWNKLTNEEKKEFQNMASDGRLGNLVEIWTPWWMTSKPLVTEVKEKKIKSEQQNCFPDIVSDIPNISQILKLKPSSDVKYNVINVIYAYCFICRLHNGEHITMATDCANAFIVLSDVLGQGGTCGSVDEAVQLCMKRLMSTKDFGDIDNEYNVSIVKDVETIISGSDENEPLRFILGALSEVHKIFKKSYKTYTKKLKNIEFSKDAKEKQQAKKTKLFQMCKKCEFYLSWAQTYGMALCGLVPELQIVYSLLSAELESVNQSKSKLEAEWGGKLKPKRNTLIQEL